MAKTLKNFIIASIIWGLYGVFKVLPVDAASFVAGWIATKIGPRLPVSRRARRHIAFAFPNLSHPQIEQIIKEMWDNLGRTAGEYPHLKTILNDSKRIEIQGSDHIEAIKNDQAQQNNPCLFFSAHIANWELSAMVLAKAGLSLCLIYRAANNPFIDRLIQRARGVYPSLTYAPKGKAGGRHMLQTLQKGGNIGMLVDQKMNTGMAVDFFGKKAWTVPSLIQFSERYQAPIIATRVIRKKGAYFQVIFEPPYEILPFSEKEKNSQEDLVKALRHMNQIVERWVREYPGQWLWLHQRWGKL